MKQEKFKTIAVCLAMAFMFCLGSHMQEPVPFIVQGVIGFLMIICSFLARKKPLKNIED